MTHPIILAVARYYGFDHPAHMLDTQDRSRRAKWARWTAAYLIRAEGYSLPEVAAFVSPGRVGHTSVLQGIRSAQALLDADIAAFRDGVKAVQDELGLVAA